MSSTFIHDHSGTNKGIITHEFAGQAIKAPGADAHRQHSPFRHEYSRINPVIATHEFAGQAIKAPGADAHRQQSLTVVEIGHIRAGHKGTRGQPS